MTHLVKRLVYWRLQGLDHSVIQRSFPCGLRRCIAWWYLHLWFPGPLIVCMVDNGANQLHWGKAYSAKPLPVAIHVSASGPWILTLCNPLASKAALIFFNPLKLLFGINAPIPQHSSIRLFWMLWPTVAPAPSFKVFEDLYDISNIIVLSFGLEAVASIRTFPSMCCIFSLVPGLQIDVTYCNSIIFGNLEMLHQGSIEKACIQRAIVQSVIVRAERSWSGL